MPGNISLPAAEPMENEKHEAMSDSTLDPLLDGAKKIFKNEIEESVAERIEALPVPNSLEEEMRERKARLEASMTPEQARHYEAKKAEMVAKSEELGKVEAAIQSGYGGSLFNFLKRAAITHEYKRLKDKRETLRTELRKADAELIRMNLYAHLDPDLDRSYKKVGAFRRKRGFLTR